MYQKKIEANDMTDEDWKLLVKETGRWMPHVNRNKTSMFYPQDAEWNFDASQIAKVKSMFHNLPAQSSKKNQLTKEAFTENLKCPQCGNSESVTPAHDNKLNKCDACQFSF